ncbi:MAG: hypothetical protein R2912_08710 [Eubacteriales bacterium]
MIPANSTPCASNTLRSKDALGKHGGVSGEYAPRGEWTDEDRARMGTTLR